MKLSIVLPVYNEAGVLENSLEKIENNLKSLGYDYEIIIAEDGSTDGTDRLCREISSRNKKVRHLHSDEKLGRGRALKNSFLEARGDVFVYFDIDLATDLRHLKSLVEEIENGCDISTGCRLNEKSQINRSFLREIASRGYNLMAKILFNTKISDMQCGFKAFHRRTLPVLLKSRDNRWFWDTETLLLGEKYGLKISEIPVVWRESSDSKVNVMKDSFEMGLSLLKLRIRLI